MPKSDNVPCPQTRPTPPHLTSAMAENILAAACENESRNAAKRMRLEAYHVGTSSCRFTRFEHSSPEGLFETTLLFLFPVPGRTDRSGQAVQWWRRPEGALSPRSLRLLPGVVSLPLPGRHALHQRSWNQLHLPWLPWAGRHHAAPGVPDWGNLGTEQR